MVFQIRSTKDFISVPCLSSLMASATQRRKNLLRSSWLLPRVKTLTSEIKQSSLTSQNLNYDEVARCNYTQFPVSHPPGMISIKKKNPHQKHIPPDFTDARHRRNKPKGSSLTHAVKPDFKALWRAWQTACLEEAFCVRLAGSQKQQNPIKLSLPHATKRFLRPLLSFLWNYFCQS